jgi:hypothetical protein
MLFLICNRFRHFRGSYQNSSYYDNDVDLRSNDSKRKMKDSIKKSLMIMQTNNYYKKNYFSSLQDGQQSS